MKDAEKIKLADAVLALIGDTSEKKMLPVFVGTTENRFGINGFKVADIGTAVFELNEKHVIYLETLDGKNSIAIPFYKGDLSIKKSDTITL